MTKSGIKWQSEFRLIVVILLPTRVNFVAVALELTIITYLVLVGCESCSNVATTAATATARTAAATSNR